MTEIIGDRRIISELWKKIVLAYSQILSLSGFYPKLSLKRLGVILLIFFFGTIVLKSQVPSSNPVICLENEFESSLSTLILANHTVYSDHVIYLKDKGYDIEEVKRDSLWKNQDLQVAKDSYDRKADFWLKFRFCSEENETIPYLLKLQDFARIEIYLPDNDNSYHMVESGYQVPLSGKAFPDRRHNLFQVKDIGKDTITVFARVTPRLVSVNMPPTPKFEVIHVDQDSYYSNKSDFKWYLIFHGFLLTLVLLSLIIYFIVREPILLYFSLISLGQIIFEGVARPPQFLIQLFPSLIAWKFLLISISVLSILKGVHGFYLLLLHIKDTLPKFWKLVQWYFRIMLVVVIMILLFQYNYLTISEWFNMDARRMDQLGKYSYVLCIVFYTIGFLFVLLIPIAGWIKKVKWSRYLLFSSVIPAGSTIIFNVFDLAHVSSCSSVYQILNRSLIISIGGFTSVQVGVFSFLILIGILVGIRAKEVILERQKALESIAETEKKVSDQLRKIDKLKNQFLSTTSHELRTPLQGIIGLSDTLQEKISNPRWKADLSLISSSGKRLANLVNDLLDFSKIREDNISIDPKSIDIRVVVDIVLQGLRPLAQRKQIELFNNIPKDIYPALADEARIQQILYNLIGNAIKFTEKGYVMIDTEVREGVIKIMVQDTGIGISEEYHEEIFYDFTQVSDAETRSKEGSGLGLSITKKLVELQGGEIWVDSVPEKGSVFSFTLPLALSGSPSVSNSIVELQQPELSIDEKNWTFKAFNKQSFIDSDYSLHILSVDDDPVNQQVIQHYLEDEGTHVTAAMNGQDALDAISSGIHFDLVLLDIMMPGMSGYEVCQNIRKQFLSTELPVIMVTAMNQIKDVVQGLEFGANDYITKPFSKEELKARIRTHVDLNKIFEATGRFVPTEFLKALGKIKITEVQLGDHVERDVTVLFTDIREFTPLSESMSPEDNFRFVNALNGRLGPIVRRNHGFINQYLGDAIMAIFTESPVDALKCALEIQEAVTAYNKERIQKDRKPIRLGIGFHSGPLVMGIIGDTLRMDAATISDTVNTASRIESLTKKYQSGILLSEFSHELIQKEDGTSIYEFIFLGDSYIKGKDMPMGIYECKISRK